MKRMDAKERYHVHQVVQGIKDQIEQDEIITDQPAHVIASKVLCWTSKSVKRAYEKEESGDPPYKRRNRRVGSLASMIWRSFAPHA